MDSIKHCFAILLVALLFSGCSESMDGELILVEPRADDGFQFPYYLFIPDHVSTEDSVFMVVEPNNSGFVDDDLQKHMEKARRTATKDFYMGHYLAQEFQYPLVVPVFPRPKTDWKIYTHALDRDAMLQKVNALERLDEQLINMVDDARKRLEEKQITTHLPFLLTGFSASGTFANRFTVLHPDRVFAVAAGGLNGLLMLPLDSLNGEILKYPVGVGDMEELTGSPFRKEQFLNTPQFYFMGGLDDNDAVPYNDGYDENEREQIYRLLGKQMQPERWERCRQIYRDIHVDAVIRTYEGLGHEHPEEVKQEIVRFFQVNIDRNSE